MTTYITATRYVDVRVDDLRYMQTTLMQVESMVTTWAGISSDNRVRIFRLIDAALKKVRPLAKLRPASVELSPASIMGLINLAGDVSSRIHSVPRVNTLNPRSTSQDDRRRALGSLAGIRKRLMTYIQLDLFPVAR